MVSRTSIQIQNRVEYIMKRVGYKGRTFDVYHASVDDQYDIIVFEEPNLEAREHSGTSDHRILLVVLLKMRCYVGRVA